MGPDAMTGILVRKGEFDTETERHTGRRLWENEGRDPSDSSTSQGTLTIANKQQEPGGSMEQVLP